MHTISKHQCSALQTKWLGLTLKYSIFIPFPITKIVMPPLPLVVPNFQTLTTFSNLFSLVTLVSEIIWMSKSLIFQPLFLTPSNNSNVSERSISTEYSDWCFCHLWIFLHYLSITEACKSRAVTTTTNIFNRKLGIVLANPQYKTCLASYLWLVAISNITITILEWKMPTVHKFQIQILIYHVLTRTALAQAFIYLSFHTV